MCACFDVLVGQDRLQQFADEQDLCRTAGGRLPRTAPCRNRTTRRSPMRTGGKPAAVARQRRRPSYCNAGGTNRPGTGPRSAGRTTGAAPRKSGRKPGRRASAGTAASPPYLARPAAQTALRPTGSPADAATTREGPRPQGIHQVYQEALLARQASRVRTGYNPRHDDHQQPGRLP